MHRAFCLILSTVFSSAALAADWPGFLGPDRDGRSEETSITDRIPEGGPPIVWRRKVGDGFSGPVVVGDKIVLFHQVDDQAVVECLNIQDASVEWASNYPCVFRGGLAGGGPGTRATPSIVDGMVFTMGPLGNLQCLRMSDGKRMWSRNLNEEYRVPRGFFGVSGSPLVDGDQIVVNVGGKQPNSGIVALDRHTGKTVWSSTDDESSYSSPIAATLDGNRRILVFARSGLHCLNPADGAQQFFFRWRARINASVNAATPLTVGSVVFITSSYNTGSAALAVTGNDYKKVWTSSRIMSSQYNTPVIADGYLYGIDGRADAGFASLQCVELATGEIMWSEEHYGCASVIWVDGKLVLFTDHGQLELANADPKRFNSRGKMQLFDGRDCRAHPALANGQLYVRGPDELVRIDLSE